MNFVLKTKEKKMLCKKCVYYEGKTKEDNRESCSKLLDVLADVIKTTKGTIVIIDSKEIKSCDKFRER